MHFVYSLGAADPDGNKNYNKHYTNGAGTVNFLTNQAGTGGGQSGDGVTSVSGPSFSAAGGDYSLTWKVAGDNITFMMKAKTTGWVGFGLGQSSQMPNADMYVGWVRTRLFLSNLKRWERLEQHIFMTAGQLQTLNQ
jgi:hypothetical protein